MVTGAVAAASVWRPRSLKDELSRGVTLAVNDTLEYEARWVHGAVDRGSSGLAELLGLEIDLLGQIIVPPHAAAAASTGEVGGADPAGEGEGRHPDTPAIGWQRVVQTLPAAWEGAKVHGILFRCNANGSKALLRDAVVVRAAAAGGGRRLLALLPGEAPVAA